MKKLHLVTLFIALVFSLVVFTGASNGPGVFYNSGYTAAPFDGGVYCTGCHGGGSFSPVLNLELLDNNNQPVSYYTPNTTYTLHLSLSSATGPATRRYGFQVVPSSSFTSGSSGAWGTPPANVHTININGRDYVEHSTPLASGQIYLPWTAPGPGNGTINFYAAGNIVNYNFDASGDNPVAASLSVMANPLSGSSLHLSAEKKQGHVVLKWSRNVDEHVSKYTVERSGNGTQFMQIAEVNGGANEFIDQHPLNTNYYRIVQHMRNSLQQYSTVVRISTNDIPHNYHYVNNNSIEVQIFSDREQYVNADVYSMNGHLVSSMKKQLGEGVSVLSLEKPAVSGMYLIYVKNERSILYNSRVVTY